MIIDSPPRFVRAFFRPVRPGLSRPQFHHVWTLALGLLLKVRRAKLTHLTGALSVLGSNQVPHAASRRPLTHDIAGKADAGVHCTMRALPSPCVSAPGFW